MYLQYLFNEGLEWNGFFTHALWRPSYARSTRFKSSALCAHIYIELGDSSHLSL